MKNKTKSFFLITVLLASSIFFISCATRKNKPAQPRKEVITTAPQNFDVFRVQRYSSVVSAKDFSEFFINTQHLYNGIEVRLDTVLTFTTLKEGPNGENIREIHRKTLERIIPPFTELKDKKILEFDNLGYPKFIIGSFDLSDESFKDFKFRRTVDGAMILTSGSGIIVDDSTGQKYNVPVKIVIEKYCPLVEKIKDDVSNKRDTKIAGGGNSPENKSSNPNNSQEIKWEKSE